MKLCIDPGHGLLNASPRRYDPGAVRSPYEEASIALDYALVLDEFARAAGIETVLTRQKRDDPMPLGERVRKATAAGCEAFISLHLNAAVSRDAHGTETLYKAAQGFAAILQHAAVASIGLRDRGVKARPGLAVLQFPGPCALVELGFITNDDDRSVLLSPRTQARFARAIVAALEEGEWK